MATNYNKSNRFKAKCIDCACCDVDKMKCYPNSVDCHSEYDLDADDLVTPKRCDFFVERKEN